MNLLLNSLFVIVVAEEGKVFEKDREIWEIAKIRGNEPVVEEQQLEVFGTDGNSVAEEGRAGFCCILFGLQDGKVLSHLRGHVERGSQLTVS